MFQFVDCLSDQDIQPPLTAFIHTAGEALLAHHIRELKRVSVIHLTEVQQRNDSLEYLPAYAKIHAKLFTAKVAAEPP